MPQHRNGTRTKQEESSGALMPYTGSTGLMTQMRDEFDRLFDRFMHQWPGMGLMRGGEQGWNWGWGLDVKDEENSVIVRAEMPGFDADDINLQVADNRLVIRAAHKAESGSAKGQGHTWRQREYYQVVTVPSGIESDKTDASYHNGVLTVHLPKSEKAKGRRVTVRKA